MEKLVIPNDEQVSKLVNDALKRLVPEGTTLAEKSAEATASTQQLLEAQAAAKAAAEQVQREAKEQLEAARVATDVPVIATIGSLGWDMDEQACLDNCRQLLERSHIPSAWHGEPWCNRETKNSTANLEMKNASCLEAAKVRIRHAQVKFPEARNNAWLDKKKSPEELAPGRWCRRAKEYLEAEIAMGTTAAFVELDMRKKTMLVKEAGRDAEPVGAPGTYGWVWFPHAARFLTDNQQDVGRAFIAR